MGQMNQSMNPDPEDVQSNTEALDELDLDFRPKEVPIGIIEDDGKADYYLEQMVCRQAEIDRLEERRQALKMRQDRVRNGMDYFKAMLELYILAIKAADPKTSTRVLAFGKLSARAGVKKVEIADVDLCEADKEQFPDFVRVKTIYEPIKKEIKDAAEAGAPIPPWATILDGETKATIKLFMDGGREVEVK